MSTVNCPRGKAKRVRHSRFFEGGVVGGWMPKNLNRYYGRGELHFVTFGCYRHLPLLATAGARNLFVKDLDEVRQACDLFPWDTC